MPIDRSSLRRGMRRAAGSVRAAIGSAIGSAIWWGLGIGMGLALAGCASVTPPAPEAVPAGLFDDARFAPASEPIDAQATMALSDSMRRFLRDEISLSQRRRSPQQALLHALADRSGLKLEYDAELTRTAAQAFDARAGNCLSLVLMTSAFAKELGLTVTYQTSVDDEVWSRSGDLYLRSGHVNLVLGRPAPPGQVYDEAMGTTVDFVPPDLIPKTRMRRIDEATVIAMFMANRAAEALVQGRLDDAYAWARASVRQSPGLLNAYNTLGVVYLRHGDLALAERALSHVLQRDAVNTQALANLEQVHLRAGDVAQAAALRERRLRLEPHPPFHFFEQGQAALARGDAKAARDLFQREIARDDRYHEFHFALAQALWQLGDEAGARHHLARAAALSSTGSDRAMYAAKLAHWPALR